MTAGIVAFWLAIALAMTFRIGVIGCRPSCSGAGATGRSALLSAGFGGVGAAGATAATGVGAAVVSAWKFMTSVKVT